MFNKNFKVTKKFGRNNYNSVYTYEIICTRVFTCENIRFYRFKQKNHRQILSGKEKYKKKGRNTKANKMT